MSTKTSTPNPALSLNRDAILNTLERFINQRPGFEPANYAGNYAAYRQDSRHAQQQRRDALELLRAVRWRSTIDTAALVKAFEGAYSGRLSLSVSAKDEPELDYCTGQYTPTEYRAAAAAVLASAIWDYTRDHAMPEPTKATSGDNLYSGMSAGDWLRRTLGREFGRGIQSRWFN